MHRSPGFLPTGSDSPLSIASSTSELPQTSAVGRNAVTGAHAQQIADDDLGRSARPARTIAQDNAVVRLQLDQLADRLAGLALGALFEKTAEQDETDNPGSRSK
jgi:hypothetical protein